VEQLDRNLLNGKGTGKRNITVIPSMKAYIIDLYTNLLVYTTYILNSLKTRRDLILVYNGKVLCPYYTLSDYCNHTATSSPVTIHASFQIKGGCFIISFTILMTILLAISMSVCTCGMSLFVLPILGPFLLILPLFCL